MTKKIILIAALVVSTATLSGCGSVGDEFKGFMGDYLSRGLRFNSL